MNKLQEHQKYALDRFTPFFPKNISKILEIGSDLECNCIDYLANRYSCKGFGINISSDFIKHKYDDTNYVKIRADGANLPFNDNSFDVVISIATMEHIQNISTFVSECHRVLMNGGYFYSYFGPIWSSCVGHHVNAKVGTKQASFWQSGKNPIPDYSHLLWSRKEMEIFLRKESPCDERLIKPIIEWIYEKPDINRLFLEDYQNIIMQSPFIVLRFNTERRKLNPIPSKEVINTLVKKHGNRNYLSYTIDIVLLKSESLKNTYIHIFKYKLKYLYFYYKKIAVRLKKILKKLY